MFISIVLMLSVFLKELKSLLKKNNNIKANILRVQASNSIMCGYFCIGFIDFMLSNKNLTDLQVCFLLMSFKK